MLSSAHSRAAEAEREAAEVRREAKRQEEAARQQVDAAQAAADAQIQSAKATFTSQLQAQVLMHIFFFVGHLLLCKHNTASVACVQKEVSRKRRHTTIETTVNNLVKFLRPVYTLYFLKSQGSAAPRRLSGVLSCLLQVESGVLPPTGHVAIVFTDIQESTAVWDAAPNMFKRALAMHNIMMRRLLVEHRSFFLNGCCMPASCFQCIGIPCRCLALQRLRSQD